MVTFLSLPGLTPKKRVVSKCNLSNPMLQSARGVYLPIHSDLLRRSISLPLEHFGSVSKRTKSLHFSYDSLTNPNQPQTCGNHTAQCNISASKKSPPKTRGKGTPHKSKRELLEQQQQNQFLEKKKLFFDTFEDFNLTSDELVTTTTMNEELDIGVEDEFWKELEKPVELVPYFDFLPDEVLLRIFTFFPVGSDFDAIIVSCRRFREVGLDNGLWKKLFLRHWGNTYSRLTTGPVERWRLEYLKKQEEVFTKKENPLDCGRKASYGRTTYKSKSLANSVFLSPPKLVKWPNKLNR